MPALVIFGRRWHIAGDDLPIPSLVGAVWHLGWEVAIAVALAYVVYQWDRETCPQRQKHIGFLACQVFFFFTNGLLHTWCFFESKRGSIFQTHRRRLAGPLVVAVLCFYLLTIGNTIYGTVITAELLFEAPCEPLPGALHLSYPALLRAIVIITWVAMTVGFIALLITYNLFPAYSAASTWQARCNLCRYLFYCCLVPAERMCGCRRRDESAAAHQIELEDRRRSQAQNLSPAIVIAQIFTEVFGTVDMVLSDHVAAFALVGARHRATKPAQLYANEPPPDWIQQQQQHDGQAAPGAAASNGKVAGGSDAAAAALLRPPVVVELAVGDRRGGSGTKAAAAVGGEASKGERGAPSPTSMATTTGATDVSITTTTTSNPNGMATTATTATTTATATTTTSQSAATFVDRGLHLPSGLPDAGAVSHAVGDAVSGAVHHVAEGAAQLGAAGNALGHKVQATVSAATAAVFGHPVLPNGELPRLVDPSCEWNGVLEPSNVTEEVMEEALYYMRFATAVYGWKMFLWLNRTNVQRWCNLCVGRGCGCCRQSAYFVEAVGPDVGPSEGCCSAVKLMEREAITQMTGAADEDILYVCYENQVEGILPYYIAVDRARRSLVLAVRGSLSLRDVVTDLLCAPAPMTIPGVEGKDAHGRNTLWAHRGILLSTLAILKHVREQGVLQAAVADWPADEQAQAAALAALPSERARVIARRLGGQCSGWRVVITGHSLGGGVTGLLGPYLRAEFPSLRCWAFAPPGGLMSPEAAALTHDYCIGLIHAKDMIPRLSVSAMEQLVQELVTAGAHSRHSKLDIVLDVMFAGRRPGQAQLFRRFEDLTREQHDVLDQYTKNISEYRTESQFAAARNFVPCGHLLYVERRKPAALEPRCGVCCSCNLCLLDTHLKDYKYACRWIQPSQLMRVGLVVSRSMFLDHLPDMTLKAMSMAYEQLCAASGKAPARPHKPGPPQPNGTMTLMRIASQRNQEERLRQLTANVSATSASATGEAATPRSRLGPGGPMGSARAGGQAAAGSGAAAGGGTAVAVQVSAGGAQPGGAAGSGGVEGQEVTVAASPPAQQGAVAAAATHHVALAVQQQQQQQADSEQEAAGKGGWPQERGGDAV
ncbi:hypothetical protein HYH02_004988 [Chlamydomonas schloesseri]|uniref:sn-1-specific diacylglycerol lipase n=1 Tax=Chlamydomonas schloesseri TaxID=2026947 RepID=A0A836B832_9CHLO|nr:hypothetical protein HYH02_004988 [Chlamydomonas schloesseri]|eukprot:KAG2450487.1 hypothetical protein HYH02_004988 [Chlamydomonas schloesseri]